MVFNFACVNFAIFYNRENRELKTREIKRE